MDDFLSTTSLFAIFYIDTVILVNVRNNDWLECYIRSEIIYYQLRLKSSLLPVVIIAASLMVLFGTRTICNTKRVHVHSVRTIHRFRTEHQLGFILLSQVCTNVALNLHICIICVMLSFLHLHFLSRNFLLIKTVVRPVVVNWIQPTDLIIETMPNNWILPIY